MSSRFSIAEGDLVPELLPQGDYDRLVKDPVDGIAVDVDSVVVAAENEFVAHLGGMFTDADNIALAKPLACDVVVYRLHARRSTNADYRIPESVVESWRAALKWAQGVGQKLLAAEGTVRLPTGGGVEYDADTAAYTMAKLDRL